MFTNLLAFAPFLIGLLIVYRLIKMLFSLPKLLKYHRAAKQIRKQGGQHEKVERPAVYILSMLVFGAIAYFCFVWGAGNFPAKAEYYSFSACQKNELRDYLTGDAKTTLRFKDIVRSERACGKQSN